MSITFGSLGLPEPIIAALDTLGFTQPFPIQAAAIPPSLTGRDIQGRAPTGSGKTLAFGLPMLALVGRGRPNRPLALVLVPTRELAEQIRKDLEPVASAAGRRIAAVYGGVAYGPQINALRRGVDVLVATPGRLEDLIDRGSVDLGDSSFVVLDEADRMSDMGFLPAVRRILDRAASQRQTLLFSATLDGEVAVLSRDYQRDPVMVHAEASGDTESDVSHHFWRVSRSDRIAETARLLDTAGRSIVFTRTRHGADRLVRQLDKENVSAVAIHGGRSQSQRTRALKAFSTGAASALVATDVAARGIHVEGVETVIHFDVPADHKDYTHRSGRTGRAGSHGVVITLVTEGQEASVQKLQRELKLSIPIETPGAGVLAASGRHSHSRPGKGGRRSDANHSRATPATPASDTRHLFVGNLPWKTTGKDLETLFSRYGDVARSTVTTHPRTGRSKGYGFVEIVEHRPNLSTKALDGFVLDGRALSVRPAR